ncbi:MULTISPECIES: hypothetical protein [Methylobacterium]|nr:MULTISPECIES: hypothetical protein [Methylobacterium]MCI9882682.1 hypothetical protein [Methylobacterium goesingense]
MANFAAARQAAGGPDATANRRRKKHPGRWIKTPGSMLIMIGNYFAVT